MKNDTTHRCNKEITNSCSFWTIEEGMLFLDEKGILKTQGFIVIQAFHDSFRSENLLVSLSTVERKLE